MNDNERLFDHYLEQIDQREAAHAPGSQSESKSQLKRTPEVTRALTLATALRHVSPPPEEVEYARMRVDMRVRAAMAQPAVAKPPGASLATLRRSRQRIVYIAVAALVLLVLGSVIGWQVSVAAADALPGSPLYILKRGEEWVATQSAWSDQRRGEVLATIANHRLREARAEADLYNIPLMRTLTSEFDSDMHQLISLTAHMMMRHEDTAVVTTAITSNMRAEYLLITSGDLGGAGHVPLAQELAVTLQMQQHQIAIQQISFPQTPPGQAPVPSLTPSATPEPTPSATSSASATPAASATATPKQHGSPHPTPPAKPAVTPTPTPDAGGNGENGSSKTNSNALPLSTSGSAAAHAGCFGAQPRHKIRKER